MRAETAEAVEGRAETTAEGTQSGEIGERSSTFMPNPPAKPFSRKKWVIAGSVAVGLVLLGGLIAMAILLSNRGSSKKSGNQVSNNHPQCTREDKTGHSSHSSGSEQSISPTPSSQLSEKEPLFLICRHNPDFRGRRGVKEVPIQTEQTGKVILMMKPYTKNFFENLHNQFYDQNGSPQTNQVQRRPLVLFGDDSEKWCRISGSNRGVSGGQASGLSGNMMDRSIAYGIVTIFIEKDSPFINDDVLFKDMIKSQFDELKDEMGKGSDIYIPVRLQSKGIKKGTLIDTQVSVPDPVGHTLGTGKAALSERRLRVIAAEIDGLIQHSGKSVEYITED